MKSVQNHDILVGKNSEAAVDPHAAANITNVPHYRNSECRILSLTLEVKRKGSHPETKSP